MREIVGKPDSQFVALLKSLFKFILHPEVQGDRSQTGMIGSDGPLNKLLQIDLELLIQDKEDEYDPWKQEITQFASDGNKSFKYLLEKEFAQPMDHWLDENVMADIIRIAQKTLRQPCRQFACDEDMATTRLAES
jgi:hypothetical protein